VRAISKAVLAAVASASAHRALVLLDLLAGMLALAAAEHGHSAELFSLITQLIKDESARLYLAARGFLPVKKIKKLRKRLCRAARRAARGFLPIVTCVR